MGMTRPDGRRLDQLRPVRLRLGVQKDPAGSVEIALGGTVVLCAATVAEGVPGWRRGQGAGWVTAEYAMLPGAVPERAGRGPSSRAREIQRLVGRSLRAAVDLAALGERTITVDCDVLQADGGTRVASVTAGCVALRLALEQLHRRGLLPRPPVLMPVVAVSCAVVDGVAVLDPCYDEDHRAEVDANFVLDAAGRFIEVQCTAEHGAFDEARLAEMVALARRGGAELLTAVQAAAPPA
jgi:ribonuclease PH